MQNSVYCNWTWSCSARAEEDVCCFWWCTIKPGGAQKPDWGWWIEREAESGIKGNTHTHTHCDEHVNPQGKKKKEKKDVAMSLLSAHTIQYTHTIFPLKIWHDPSVSFPYFVSLPTSGVPLSSCPLWPRRAGKDWVALRSGGPLGNSELRVCLNGSIHWLLCSHGSKCETLQRVPLSWVAA